MGHESGSSMHMKLTHFQQNLLALSQTDEKISSKQIYWQGANKATKEKHWKSKQQHISWVMWQPPFMFYFYCTTLFCLTWCNFLVQYPLPWVEIIHQKWLASLLTLKAHKTGTWAVLWGGGQIFSRMPNMYQYSINKINKNCCTDAAGGGGILSSFKLRSCSFANPQFCPKYYKHKICTSVLPV